MDSTNPQKIQNITFEKIVDGIVRLAVLFFLLGWCFSILKPFVLILAWAAVIAIAVYPLYATFLKLFGKRKIWVLILLSALMLSILIIPSWLVTDSLFDEVSHLRDLHNQGQLVIPPPGENTATWPTILKPVIDVWKLASENLQAAMMQYSSQLKAAGTWLLTAVAGIGMGILQ